MPYDIAGHLREIDTGLIDTNYMNSRFEKYIKLLDSADTETREAALNDLHKSFASLNQEEQKYANMFIRDIQRGEVAAGDGKTLRDYITQYTIDAKNAQVKEITSLFGLDTNLLCDLMAQHVTESNLNEYGRFDKLTASVDRAKAKAKAYFEKAEGTPISTLGLSNRIFKLLQRFVLEGGFDLD